MCFRFCVNIPKDEYFSVGLTQSSDCLWCYRFDIHLPDGFFDPRHTLTIEWTHVVLNYIGPNDGKVFGVYYNGVQEGNHTVKSGSHSAGDGRIVVGRALTDLDGFYASVQVDELTFFNQALTQEEITVLATAT